MTCLLRQIGRQRQRAVQRRTASRCHLDHVEEPRQDVAWPNIPPLRPDAGQPEPGRPRQEDAAARFQPARAQAAPHHLLRVDDEVVAAFYGQRQEQIALVLADRDIGMHMVQQPRRQRRDAVGINGGAGTDPVDLGIGKGAAQRAQERQLVHAVADDLPAAIDGDAAIAAYVSHLPWPYGRPRPPSPPRP